jgi:hypothetical protein
VVTNRLPERRTLSSLAPGPTLRLLLQQKSDLTALVTRTRQLRPGGNKMGPSYTAWKRKRYRLCPLVKTGFITRESPKPWRGPAAISRVGQDSVHPPLAAPCLCAMLYGRGQRRGEGGWGQVAGGRGSRLIGFLFSYTAALFPISHNFRTCTTFILLFCLLTHRSDARVTASCGPSGVAQQIHVFTLS